MKITVITVLSCNLIWGSGYAQYIWTRHAFNESMCGKVACEDLVVDTMQGKVQGRAFKSVLNRSEYYAFLGIPFAKPPVDDLRFQAPQPPDPWIGVYPAYYERNICDQLIFVTEILRISSEDCLYLNVYTPDVPNKIAVPKTVMVSIHGGGFVLFAGSRLFFSPDYWIARDVVVVTINYRLSAFGWLLEGFLNLGIPECSGNMGLKDQVMALKWVQQNIARFGGDPKNVVIIGESAGGTSVHYHTLSPMSKGLFHKAIVQSGTALSPWAFIYNPNAQAFEIGSRCGYSGDRNPRKLLKHLKAKSRMSISYASLSWIVRYRQMYPAKYILLGPTLETAVEGAFLPDWPSNLIKSATPVPTMFGFNNKEGISVIVGFDNQLLEKASRNFSLLLTDMFPLNSKLVPEASSKIKRVYLGDKRVGIEAANELVDLYSDMTNYYAYDAMEFLATSSTPPFIYYFAYEGNFNYAMKVLNLIRGIKLKGAAHSDDQLYMYYPYVLSSVLSIDSKTKKMIYILTKMLTDFAKTGNPSGVVNWNASTSNQPGYLLIDQQPRMMSGRFHDERFEVLRNTIDPAIKPGTRPYDIY